jgi:metallo-beta-lactamase family protein
LSTQTLDSFSGHADHSELLHYFRGMSGSRKKVWLVHGEQERSEVLRDALKDVHKGEVTVGKLGTTVEF